ncbi:MAG TPA: DUF5808 domain-containing protein [Candidatus Saccharimonadales bacterium]|nr:DUF5808 domain-containing protein [Candidatus Saccharimonadales bacterium]
MSKKSKVGTFWGVPYDWRKPTMARYRERLWNPNDPRLYTPRAWGWGYDLNFYWLFHSRPKR